MKWRLAYEPGARALVRHLPPALKAPIKAAIESLQENPFAGKELKLELDGYRSLRTRRYRVLYRLDPEHRSVEIHWFGPRADVYDSFRRLLTKRAPTRG